MPNQTLQLPTCYPQNDTVFLIKRHVRITTVAILTSYYGRKFRPEIDYNIDTNLRHLGQFTPITELNLNFLLVLRKNWRKCRQKELYGLGPKRQTEG
jgi:hypothetical protein